MLAIRYVTLAALVVWLGGLVTFGLVGMPSGGSLGRFQLVGYACGAVIFVCLIVLKFVGPPPRDFFPRIGLVSAMILIALYPRAEPRAASLAMSVNIALGAVLLFWYARE